MLSEAQNVLRPQVIKIRKTVQKETLLPFLQYINTYVQVEDQTESKNQLNTKYSCIYQNSQLEIGINLSTTCYMCENYDIQLLRAK